MNKHRTHNTASGERYRLKAETRIIYRGEAITLPEGALVFFVEGDGGGYAIESEALLVELTGDTHSPRYYYAWVNASDVAGA